jgi:hypothetical protein
MMNDRRGFGQIGDRLREFGGRPIHSANQFLNILGTYPAGWPVRVVYEHDGHSITRTVRLERLPVQKPFEPDVSLNRDETRRILTACRQALGVWPAKATLKWSAHRQQGAADLLRIEASESSDGGGQLQVKQVNGQSVREVQYNGRTAQVREAARSGGLPFAWGCRAPCHPPEYIAHADWHRCRAVRRALLAAAAM